MPALRTTTATTDGGGDFAGTTHDGRAHTPSRSPARRPDDERRRGRPCRHAASTTDGGGDHVGTPHPCPHGSTTDDGGDHAPSLNVGGDHAPSPGALTTDDGGSHARPPYDERRGDHAGALHDCATDRGGDHAGTPHDCATHGGGDYVGTRRGELLTLAPVSRFLT